MTAASTKQRIGAHVDPADPIAEALARGADVGQIGAEAAVDLQRWSPTQSKRNSAAVALAPFWQWSWAVDSSSKSR